MSITVISVISVTFPSFLDNLLTREEVPQRQGGGVYTTRREGRRRIHHQEEEGWVPGIHQEEEGWVPGIPTRVV